MIAAIELTNYDYTTGELSGQAYSCTGDVCFLINIVVLVCIFDKFSLLLVDSTSTSSY